MKRVSSSLTSERHVFINSKPGQRLFELLAEQLPSIPKEEWPDRIDLGGLHVNGRQRSRDFKLEPGSRVEYFEPKFDFKRAADSFPAFCEDWIVEQDENLLFVFKPAGLPTLPNREQNRFNLKRYVEDFLRTKTHFPSRLDTNTAGLVPLSVSKESDASLQRIFERRAIQKRYLLRTEAALSEEIAGIMSEAIGRESLHAVLRTIDRMKGQSAVTAFRTLSTEPGILEARPYSGRTHQIRVHARGLGYPIRGDNFYAGAELDESESLNLLCAGLRLWRGRDALEVNLPDSLRPTWLPGKALSESW